MTPSRKADSVSRLRELIETPLSRLGRPHNWKPSKMKSVWKTASCINPNDPIFRAKPADWGKGTENSSKEIDKILYG